MMRTLVEVRLAFVKLCFDKRCPGCVTLDVSVLQGIVALRPDFAAVGICFWSGPCWGWHREVETHH